MLMAMMRTVIQQFCLMRAVTRVIITNMFQVSAGCDLEICVLLRAERTVRGWDASDLLHHCNGSLRTWG